MKLAVKVGLVCQFWNLWSILSHTNDLLRLLGIPRCASHLSGNTFGKQIGTLSAIPILPCQEADENACGKCDREAQHGHKKMREVIELKESSRRLIIQGCWVHQLRAQCCGVDTTFHRRGQVLIRRLMEQGSHHHPQAEHLP